MPAVRNTPARRRMTCPACGRDVSYTLPWIPSTLSFGDRLMRDHDRRILKAHTDPNTRQPCAVNGPHGFGLDMTEQRP